MQSSDYKHPQWLKRRQEVINQANGKCKRCDKETTSLHVHHINYKFGKELWEYEDKELTCFCDECHAREHEMIRMFRRVLAKLSAKGADDVSLIIGIMLNLTGEENEEIFATTRDVAVIHERADYWSSRAAKAEIELGLHDL